MNNTRKFEVSLLKPVFSLILTVVTHRHHVNTILKTALLLDQREHHKWHNEVFKI